MAEEDEDDDDLAGEMPELDELVVLGDDRAALELDPKVVRRFLSKQRALDICMAVVRPLVPAQHVEDLAADAVVRALKARPPRVEAVLPAWLAVIARRVAARWLEKRKRRAKHEGAMPIARAREDDYTGHAVEDHVEPVRGFFDDGAAEEAEDLVEPYLESILAPHDRPIYDVLCERAAGKKTYADLAAERGMSVDQLYRKIRRFKTKYAPRVRRRRTMMLLLKLGGVAVGLAVAAVLLYLFLHRPPSKDDALPDPATHPLPSATASVEAPLIAEQTRKDARDLRDSALVECRALRWGECLKRLDAAKAMDPAGDDAPEVQSARAQAKDALEGKKP